MSKLSKVRLHRLFQLAQRLLALEPDVAEASELLEPFQNVFGITSICLFDANSARFHVIGSPRSELARQTRVAYDIGQDQDDPANGITIRCLQVGGRVAGAIAFEGLEAPQLTAGPLVSLVTALHERMRLRRKTNESEVAAEIEAFRSAIFNVLDDEFKNALTTILTAAGGLREAGALLADQLEMVRIVEEEASRLGSVISWLDRITRLNQEEISPRMDATNLTVLMAQAVEQCSRIWPGQRIVFAGRESFFKVFGDGELIRLALSQLLDQACKFAEPGSAVQVEIEALGGAVVVRVSIEGNGIPYHDLDHVFERSYLGSRAPSFATGSGLGLYVGRKIAVAHGGTLDFDAERMGTDCVVFRLSLPRANGQLDEQ